MNSEILELIDTIISQGIVIPLFGPTRLSNMRDEVQNEINSHKRISGNKKTLKLTSITKGICSGANGKSVVKKSRKNS